MLRSCLLFLYLLSCLVMPAQQPIIDMHLHCYLQDHFRFPVKDPSGNPGSADAQAHFMATFTALKKYGITNAVISGSVEAVDSWMERDTAHRFIRGLMMDLPTDGGMDTLKFRELIQAGKIQIYGEVGPYYSGTTLSDSIWQPYLRICEEFDIPVAVHTGGGDPGGTYTWSPKARLRLGDPYLIEDVLVRYPKLRVYIMHSGEDWYEHTLRLMAYYPNLYSDLGVLLWVEPQDQRYAREFLKYAKEAGLLNRVMYGTDQMRWPYAIGKSINYLNSLTFLTAKDKRDIFYNNAARFLRLEQLSGARAATVPK